MDFLKQCAAENKRLVEKVPAVADRKITMKDAALTAVSLVAVAGALIQIFFR